MYIAVIQNNPKVGALRENAKKLLEAIDALAASAYPPDLVVFPAFALTGTPIGGLQVSDAFAAETTDVTRSIIKKSSLPTLIGTMMPRPLPEEMSFFCEPEVLFCKEKGMGGPLGFVDIESSWDLDNYASSITFNIDDYTVSVLLDEYPEEDDDFSDSQLVIMMMANEYRGTNTMLTASDHLGYLRRFAQRNAVWVVVANLVGAQDVTVFDGASVIIKPDGSVASSLMPFVEGVMSYNIEVDSHKPQATKTPSTAVKDEQLVRPLLPYEADWRALELFIRDYVHKNGFTDVVIGLSGGIDSAVLATLACDALGADHVHAVMMPGPFSSQGSVDDSLELAKNLGLKTYSIPIDETHTLISSTYERAIGQEDTFIARQNVQARIRMLYLMHLSNSFNWLLLNANNKSEVAMGYSTLYGDTAGAIAPLGNVYKTDVYGLAHWRNKQNHDIPKAILDKPPSAELYESQTDQDSLPPYELLDRILQLHIEEGLGADQILLYASKSLVGGTLSEDLVEKILNTVKLAEFKRRQEPPSPALGYTDMSIDRDWPITNGFVDRHRGLHACSENPSFSELLNKWEQSKDLGFLAN